MAKRKTSKGQTEYKGQFVCRPYVSNRLDFQEFIKNLGDGNLITQIAFGFTTLILGMTLIAQVTSRTKNLSLGNHFQLDSINFYIRRVVVNSEPARLATGVIVAYATLKYFANADEVLAFLDQATRGTVQGSLRIDLEKFPSRANQYRGGLFKSLQGRFSTSPVYNPNEFGIRLVDITCDNVLSAAGLDFVEISVESIVENLIGLFGRRVLVFPDAQTFGTESNLTPLELQIVSLSGDPPLNITRLPPEDTGNEDLPDPNEPGIPALERFIRSRKRDQKGSK